MAILEKTIRSGVVSVASLFIGLSLFGVGGVWMAARSASEAAQKGFGLVETAATVVDSGVARVMVLVATSRTEVREASETITAAGARAQVNTPALSALNQRLKTSLASPIAQIQQLLTPVRDAVVTAGNVVTLLNSLPMVADRAPRLEALDKAFRRLEGLSADTTQLRSTLRALVERPTSGVSLETLNGLTQRIDTLLSEVHTAVSEVRDDIAALQLRLAICKARVLFALSCLALLATLVLAWILYSQIVVIRHYRR